MKSNHISVSSPAVIPGLVAEVVFGSPKHGCNGSGICRVFTITGARRLRRNQRRVPVLIVVQSSGYPVFWVQQSLIPRALSDELFSGETFRMEEDFFLNGSIARSLGRKGILITEGQYSLRQRSGWLLIDFSQKI